MSAIERVRAWFWRRGDGDAPAPRYPLFLLNTAIGLPTHYAAASCVGGPEATHYLLDYNYIDRERSLNCLTALAAARQAQRLDFSGKTLLLVAKGLHPLGDELFALARTFAAHHVFVELWNGIREVVQLADAHLEHVSYLPVTSRLRRVRTARVAAAPNHRIFVSLGGDDDLELIAETVAGCPRLQFFVPTVSWGKPGSDKRYVDVHIRGDNVTPVDCGAVQRDQQLSFSPAYHHAFDACDTVLIATRSDKMFQMRGGIRIADALFARKHIVMTENAPAQLLMAQHEHTCLVAAHRAADLRAHLQRVTAGAFAVDEPLYEAIRALTGEAEKLAWMAAAADPIAAGDSPFARDDDPLGAARRQLLERGGELLTRAIAEQANDVREAGGHSGADPRRADVSRS